MASIKSEYRDSNLRSHGRKPCVLPIELSSGVGATVVSDHGALPGIDLVRLPTAS